jgi:hypothetical protein
MRTVALVSSFAALLVSAPLAAQGRGKHFRTDDPSRTSQIPQIPRTSERTTRSSRDKIPPGQLPPAGMCRIWIDGVPPGQQPAPTDCQTAVANRPANARVIWGSQQSFPGKGKSKFRTQIGNQGTVVNGQRRGGGDDDGDDDSGISSGRRRGQGSDDANDDRDGDENGRGSVGSTVSQQIPVIGSIPTSSRREFSKKGKKGKGHGDD